MKLNQIAKMITEDPDEVNPLDNTEDKFEDPDSCDRPCHKCGSFFVADVGQYCESCDTMWCNDCAQAAVAQTRLGFDDHYGNGVHTACPNCTKKNKP
jgi:hypothetical protein